MSVEPILINGGIAIDDRGQLTFSNEFDISKYRRFYNLNNHTVNFVRAWHGHKKEGKAFFVQEGAFLISLVRIDNWDKPSKSCEVHRYILSAKKPSVLIVPAGFANGSMNLLPGSILTVFSTSTLEESLNDDYRYESTYWNPWVVEAR